MYDEHWSLMGKISSKIIGFMRELWSKLKVTVGCLVPCQIFTNEIFAKIVNSYRFRKKLQNLQDVKKDSDWLFPSIFLIS